MLLRDKDNRIRDGYDTRDLSVASLKVGKIMLTERNVQHWGNQMSKRIGLQRSTIHRIVKNFERQGWVTVEYEKLECKRARVLFELTDIGVAAIRDALIPFQHAPIST